MMKRLLLTSLLAPLAIGCGSDSKDPGGSEGPAWEGTYLIDIPQTAWVEPEGIGEDVGLFVHQFILDVEGVSATEYSVTMGPAKDGAQDTCSKTATVSATGTPPNLTIGPVEFELFLPAAEGATMEFADYKVIARIPDFTLTNVLPDGDTPAEAGELSATADARDLWPLFYQVLSANPDTVCGTIEQAGGAPCVACDDDEPYCLTMVARGIGAVPFDGSLERISESCEEVRPADE